MESLTFAAGLVSVVAGMTELDATRALPGWDFGSPDQKPNLAEGKEGSQKVDEADYGDRTMVFPIERKATPGDNDSHSRAWLQTWTALEGAVAASTTGTLRVISTTGTDLTFDLLTAKVEATNRGELDWSRGWAQAKVTVTARPFGRGTPITAWSGSATSTSFVGSDAVPGDVPALLDLTATWTAPTGRAEAIVSTGPNTKFVASALTNYAGWASATVAGSQSATVMQGPVAVGATAFPVATIPLTTTERAWGRAGFIVNAACFGGPAGAYLGGTAAEWQLIVNGRIAQRISVPFPQALDPATVNPWRTLRFAPIDVSSAVVQIACRVAGAVAPLAAIDFVTASRCDSSALLRAEEPFARKLIGRDSFPAGSGDGTLNSRSLEFGGLWVSHPTDGFSADDGVGDAPGRALVTFTSTAGDKYALADLSAAGQRFSCRVNIPVFASPGAIVVLVALADALTYPLTSGTSGNQVAGVVFGASALNCAFSPVIASSTGHLDYVTKTVANFGATATFDVVISLTATGRWAISVAPPGGVPTVWTGHAPALTSAKVPMVTLTTLSPQAGKELSFTNVASYEWVGPSVSTVPGTSTARPITDATAVGDRITCRPGEVPRAVVMSAQTDAQASLGIAPATCTGVVTPRYLQVPEL